MSTNLLERIDADLIEPHRLADAAIDVMLIDQRRPPDERHGLTARDALAVLVHEARIVHVAAWNLALGVTLTDEDRDALGTAFERITTIMELANAQRRR